MAGVERAKRALWSLLRCCKVQGSAKLTVTTAKGKLKVILEESFDVQPNAIKAPKRPSPSRLRRKEKRAADPAVRQRAAAHEANNAAEEVAAAEESEEALPSPEKVRSSYVPNSLVITPVKEDVREEVLEEAVEKRSLSEVPPDFEDRANNDYYHDFEKVKEAEKILAETDRCCFCEYQCPPPTLEEDKDRECSFGVLQSLWDHIEQSHPLAFEWLS